MKKTILIVAALIVAFAVLLPFASKTPDGLQTLTENSASQAQKPIWNGLMAEYSVALADPYISTLVAGLLGVGIVLAAGFGLGATLTQKKRGNAGEQM
jgi:hypothetical protein